MKEKILVVDDELIIANGIKSKLNQIGYDNVHIAVTGEEAVRTAFETSPSAIIMDIKLGDGMDGIEAAEMICSKQKIPILYITGYSDKSLCERAKHTNPYSYILKPYDMNELRINLEIAIHKSKADNEIIKLSAFFKTVLDSIQDGISVLDNGLTIRYINRKMQEWYKENLPVEGKKCFEAFQNRISPCDPCPSKRCIESGQVEKEEVKGLPGSPARFIELFSYPIKNRDETVSGVVEFVRDITKRKQAEEALRQSAEMFRVLAMSSMDAIVIADESGSIVFCNSAAENITGYSSDELIGKPVFILRPEQYQNRQMKKLKEYVAGGKSEYMNRIIKDFIVKKDGSEIPVEVSTTSWRQGDRLFMGGFIRDLTDRKKLEEYDLMKRNFDALETLFGWLAHDMNNLHAGIFGCMEIALDNADNAASVKEWLKKASKPAETATALIKRFLMMTRGVRPRRRAVCIEDMIKSEIIPAFVSAQTDICFDFSKKLPKAYIDKELIKDVFNIIVENSVEAMPEGGELKISAESFSTNNRSRDVLKEGEYIKIVFKDSGCGMDFNTKSNAFVPYFSTKDRGSKKGQGLSLPVAYSVIKQHEGHIEIESETGRGTQVKVWLPVAAKDPLQKKVKKGVSEAARKVPRRVLVLDDEDFMRNMISMMLERMGIEHVLVSRGEDAVETYFKAMEEDRPFGLAILDLTIKDGMGGVEALREIKKKDPSVRAVVVSGYSEDPVITRYREYGFYSALAKPFHLTDFEKMLKKGLK